jgi:hypothetical protein
MEIFVWSKPLSHWYYIYIAKFIFQKIMEKLNFLIPRFFVFKIVKSSISSDITCLCLNAYIQYVHDTQVFQYVEQNNCRIFNLSKIYVNLMVRVAKHVQNSMLLNLKHSLEEKKYENNF